MWIRLRLPQAIRASIPCSLLLGLLLCCLDSAARAQSIESNTATHPGGGLLGENPFKAPPRTEAEKKRDEDDWTIKISNAPKYADAGWSYIYYHTKDPKRFQKAWGYFEQSISCDSRYIDAYRGRGLAKMLLEQLPEALEDFDFVLSKEPGRERTRSMRAYVRAALAQYGDEVALRAAEQDLDQAGVTERKNPFSRAAQGMIAATRGDCSGAVAHLSWAIEHGFDTWTCRGTRANAYMHLRDYPRAIADIEHEIKKHPSWRGPHRSLGACHAEMGKPELALADYANELKLDPKNLGVLFERFSVAIESGKPEASLEDLGRLIARHPNHPYALASRGLVRWLT
ncbi:MAG: tetratricopeptide repeat protein, partial [Isosphaeraceae bacterium]